MEGLDTAGSVDEADVDNRVAVEEVTGGRGVPPIHHGNGVVVGVDISGRRLVDGVVR